MGRTVRRAGAVVATAVLALGAAACTGQDGGTPEPTAKPTATATATATATTTATATATAAVHRVVLAESAPAAARWVLDELARMHEDTSDCPVPTLENTVVLDRSEGSQDWADVVWLEDDSRLCLASATRVDGLLSIAVTGGPPGAFTARKRPRMIGDHRRLSLFVLFPVDTRQVVLRGDARHRFGPLHQRVIDLGGGKAVTVVQYGFATQVPGSPAPGGQTMEPPYTDDDSPLLCPAVTEPCRSADVDG
ncbi:hypothetical protein AB0F71_13500 [Kitasatospora sp. NPDC028055]|uniref:hypothetical protein n=1 Tax=Kitasatospora sp. NPDC028055 TaxID=3155653 RepID=UPI0033D02D5B